MQTIFYFIRHGEVFNPDGILYGRLPNFPLSEKGRVEISETAQFLKSKHISRLYASPLHRAQETAQIIQKELQLPILTSEEILEVRTAYEGKLFAELDPKQFWVYDKPLSKADETIEQIGERMMTFVQKLVTEHSGEHIAVCSHGDPIMILATMIKKLPLNPENIKGGVYIKHGEVFQLTDNDGEQSIESIFIPELAK